MKNQLVLFLSLLVLSLSCEKNVIGIDGDPNTPVTEVGLTKKGAAFSNNSLRWSHKTSELGAHWMYSWGNIMRDEIPENVEFVPMFWGRGSVTQENINRIKQLVAEGKVKYVLGFNEPDGADQANMSVDEAIALWPMLEQIGVPLVSPATVNPNNAWMQEFMRRADAQGLRVDHVAVHHYGGASVTAFIDKLKQTYQAYNRPIWVTEFAVADWSATTAANNRYSQTEVLAFMDEALKAMDEIKWVHRYAWFDGRQAPLRPSALFDEDGNITPVGQLYAGHRRNGLIGAGRDTEFNPAQDPNELLTNGGFEAGQIAPWQGFKNGVVTAATTAPHAGNFCGRIENGDGSLLYVVNVQPDSTYELRFFSKWRENVSQTFIGTLRNNADNSLIFSLPPMPMTDQWQETVYSFTVPQGVTQLRMSFYKAQGFPPFFMDDVSLKKVR